jgi:RND family efflux transporter MFP subunit
VPPEAPPKAPLDARPDASFGDAPGEPARAASGGVPAWVPSAADTTALCQALTQQASLDDSLRHLENHLREQGGASQIRLGWFDKGHVSLNGRKAASHSADEKLWAAAMEEALDQGQALRWPPDPTQPQQWVTLAHKQLAGHEHAAVLTLVLPGPSAPMGALSLTWPSAKQAPGHEMVDAWQRLVTQAAPVLGWQRHASRPWHWHLRQQLGRKWLKGQQGVRQHPALAWGMALSLLAALTVLPLPERVGGQGRIEGAQQRVLVATTDGFIKQVHAQPGDKVKAGQVLADLAEQDLKLEQEKWASQVAQQDNAYAAAMTRADRAEAALAMSRLEEAQAQLALVNEQLQRTQLKAPFDGVLIQGDLTQSIGAPVKQGDTLMTVASTQRWRVIIEIDEADIARVHAGQPGEIALSALPWDTLALRVRRITPLATAKEGRNLFEVEAEFTAPVPPEVRPGLTGQAKVRIGSMPLLWNWLRPVAERVRLGWWSVWG